MKTIMLVALSLLVAAPTFGEVYAPFHSSSGIVVDPAVLADHDNVTVNLMYGEWIIMEVPIAYSATELKLHHTGSDPWPLVYIYTAFEENGPWTWYLQTEIPVVLDPYPLTVPSGTRYLRLWGLAGIVGLDAVEIVVTNTPPVAAPDSAETQAGVAVTIAVLENDHDDDGDPLIVDSVGQAANGIVALNSDSTVTYTPNPGFTGTDAFLYTISDGKGGTSEAEVTVAVDPRNVLIDIKPGSYPNSINLGSNGVVPLAILSTVDFDATTVDPATVSLAGSGVAVRGKGNRYMADSEDVNGDELPDLVLQVETENLVPEQLQDGFADVVGATYDGVPIFGTDEIRIVPPQ